MSEIGTTKETIAYLKFWLGGVMVVSDVSLVGWLLSNSSVGSGLRFYGAVLAVVVITASAFLLHRKIERLISELTEL